MLSGDERLPAGPTELFGSDDVLAGRFADVLAQLRGAVDATNDDAILNTDAEQWSRRLARELRIDPPRVDVAAAELELERPAALETGVGSGTVDRPIAATYHLRISIPASGEIELLCSRPSTGATRLRGDLEAGRAVRDWLWPAERGADAFDREVATFTAGVADCADRIAGEVDRFNAALPERARATIEDYRTAILSEREFAGALSLPVKRAGMPGHRSAGGCWPA